MEVLGVSFDGIEQNKAFADKYGFSFPLLCDTDRKIGLAYGACDTPDAGYARRISYLIDAEGRIEQAYAKVSASAHPQEVLDSL